MFKLLWHLRFECSPYKTKEDDGWWRIKTGKIAFELGTTSYEVLKSLRKAHELGYIKDLRLKHGRALYRWFDSGTNIT